MMIISLVQQFERQRIISSRALMVVCGGSRASGGLQIGE